MRQYQLKETKEITKIICNRCGKETKVVRGIPKRKSLVCSFGQTVMDQKIEEYYVRCMFAWKWWDDAASLSFPYFLNDKV